MTLENYNYRTDPMFLRNEFRSDNTYGIPILPKVTLTDEEQKDLMLIAFNSIKSDNAYNSDRFVHFFLYDYNFEKLWTKPDESLELLSNYSGILTPDFSMYLEMPYTVQLYNTFRNRWCGAWFAAKGIKVIPTVSWGDESSFDFCFKGIPKGSVVAVSTYMFHAHNNHSDQKDVFMKGYNRMLAEIEPSAVICYSEPFPEMEGNIIYIDYELNSWQHLKDEKPTVKYIRQPFPPEELTGTYVRKTYIRKGGGSAYGGKWQPKKEDDKRFIGQPNSIRENRVNTRKGGYKATDKYGKDGRAEWERHYTDHGRDDKHTNPHDHKVDWSKGHPKLSDPINYPDGNYPDMTKYFGGISMEKDLNINSYDPEENKFYTLGEFKMYISSGWHLLFEYNNIEYGIERTSGKNLFDIWIYNKGDIANDLTIEQVLDFEIDGVKIRDFITTDDVIITDRSGPI